MTFAVDWALNLKKQSSEEWVKEDKSEPELTGSFLKDQNTQSVKYNAF